MERRSEEVESAENGVEGGRGVGRGEGRAREEEVETENPGQMCKQA